MKKKADIAVQKLPPTLKGWELFGAALFLAIANFVVVLDMTIANVSVPHIAGGLAVSSLEGTYVITSYAVAEAISVPLTGWLASRFGTLRMFTICMFLFGVFSAACGLSNQLGFLITGRALQGLSGGPLMPLSQTLLMLIFPIEKRGIAIGVWGTTTLLAPILGPIVGGYICDNWNWPNIFYINIPIAVACSFFVGRLLRNFETPAQKSRVDFSGLVLLIVWVGALQLMLDQGKNYDWFESNYIIALCVIAVIGFFSFIIWEMTDSHPIVDLRVFRHRGFTASSLTMCLTFGAFFGSVVLTPLWLQSYMGYTATWSGVTTAALGCSAVFVAPLAANLSTKVDPRMLVFCGVMWMGIWTLVRSFGATNMTHEQVALPMLIQGFGMPFFFIPLTAIALSSVHVSEIASSAGLISFIRTLSGAFATSIVTTSWENETNSYRSDLVSTMAVRHDIPIPFQDYYVQVESVMLATNHIFLVSALLLGLAATVILIAPRPKRAVDISAAH